MDAEGRSELRRVDRRRFLEIGGAATVTLLFAPHSLGCGAASGGDIDDALVRDPGGLIDLPPGFQYRLLSVEGERTLRNRSRRRIPVPGDHDGMAAFAGKGGTTVLVRNHELDGDEGPRVVGVNPYDTREPGGTTVVVVDGSRRQVDAYVGSAGTSTNCAGGATPWGTWITCEEVRATRHGYCFEVAPWDPENRLSKTPIRGLGSFSHEAIDIDPSTGIVYLTEDDHGGDIPSDPRDERDGDRAFRSSFLYRFVPTKRLGGPGSLHEGGRLQALKIDAAPRNADLWRQRQRFAPYWVTVDPARPHDDALAKGCVRFGRLEGCHFSSGAFWFSDTAGGEARRGQVFRYVPARNRLELFLEATDENKLDKPDNVVVTPWGDVWLAEDGNGVNRIVGLTPERETYTFARNNLDSEFAGPCFAPDGRTFFVNLQSPKPDGLGMTFAIWGPFARRSEWRTRRMAQAGPPVRYAPVTSGELVEAATRNGVTRLEAAAFASLGIGLM